MEEGLLGVPGLGEAGLAVMGDARLLPGGQRPGGDVEVDHLTAEVVLPEQAFGPLGGKLGRVVEATTGMYGELQGIAGRSLKEIEGLDLKPLGLPDANQP